MEWVHILKPPLHQYCDYYTNLFLCFLCLCSLCCHCVHSGPQLLAKRLLLSQIHGDRLLGWLKLLGTPLIPMEPYCSIGLYTTLKQIVLHRGFFHSLLNLLLHVGNFFLQMSLGLLLFTRLGLCFTSERELKVTSEGIANYYCLTSVW